MIDARTLRTLLAIEEALTALSDRDLVEVVKRKRGKRTAAATQERPRGKRRAA